MKKIEEMQLYKVSDLDKRICDVEGGSNTETYRDFIRNSEKEFGLHFGLHLGNIDKCSDEQ